MVKAVNDAGETQSIADFVILEPTPERMVDVGTTVAVENIDEHRVCIFGSIPTQLCYKYIYKYEKSTFQTPCVLK